ncbi:unnamed protein product [Cunninghamella blakesleeana]
MKVPSRKLSTKNKRSIALTDKNLKNLQRSKKKNDNVIAAENLLGRGTCSIVKKYNKSSCDNITIFGHQDPGNLIGDGSLLASNSMNLMSLLFGIAVF